MQILYSAKKVVNDMLSVLHLQVDVRLYDFLEITFSVLHHNVESAKRFWVLWIEEFDQLDDEGMLQLPHEGDLTENPLAVGFIFENILHSLDRDFLPSAFARGEGDLAIRARTEKLFTGVVISDLPVLKLIKTEIASAGPSRDSRLSGGLRLGLDRLTACLIVVFDHFIILTFEGSNDILFLIINYLYRNKSLLKGFWGFGVLGF